MKLSELAKAAGFKNLNELLEISGESRQTLTNWFKNNPDRFEVVLNGAVVKKLQSIKLRDN